jgi:serine/threonine protein kinase
MIPGPGKSPNAAGNDESVPVSESERTTLPAISRAPAKLGEDPLIGRVLRNTYRIVATLDEGGMGKLYRAEHLRLPRSVAVKFMARGLAVRPDALARFRREAEVISQLDHPHIVHILDFDTTEEGDLYIVMELLTGTTLSERVASSPKIMLGETVEVASQISSALMLAHASGIVHRDLKPDNVFLLSMTDQRTFVKLLDFGISTGKLVGTRLTGKYAVLGTPEYMAPEQALDSSTTDHRADQWSLACIAYEMIAGRPPFQADSIMNLLSAVVSDAPPPLTDFISGVPLAVQDVVLRGLSKKPDERFSSIAEFAERLAAAANVHTPPPRERPAPARLRTSAQSNLSHESAQKSESGRIRRYSKQKLEATLRAKSIAPPRAAVNQAQGNVDVPAIGVLIDQLRKDLSVEQNHEHSLELARDMIRRVQTAGSPEESRLLSAEADLLVPVLLRALGGRGKVLLLNDAIPTARDLSMSPHHMFIYSQIADKMTVNDLLDGIPLTAIETLSVLLDFRDSGYLSLQ